MPHESRLIALIAVGFVLALAFGFLAARVRLPPLVGYLLAGIAIVPFTPRSSPTRISRPSSSRSGCATKSCHGQEIKARD
jgi:Kef-type K+ transport system membrane component KefB